MNYIDVAVVVLIAWFTFSAFSAGIIREVVTMTGVALGVVLAGLFYHDLANDVKLAVDNNNASNIIAFLLIFGACLLAGQLAGMLLKQTASLLMLGTFDHLFGAVFGFLKGMVIVEVALILFVTFPAFGLKDNIRDSLFGPMFLDGIPILLRILPAEFQNAVDAL
ncbi:MAG TPA: CvpA family protein [Dehalococcoidia bacterium]|nr:CvpA family protein [Dehalococcoidia bacterium]